MVITTLEAEVKQELWEKLTEAYHARTREIPESILESYVVQNQATPTNWKIITVWRSQVDLDAMRATGETPTGVLIFQEAGAKPKLSIFSVAQAAR